MAIEKPEYTVLKREHGIELRDYQEHWLAECRVENTKDLNEASSRAFSKLFGYISGANEPAQKIAMTSPVQQVESEDGWLVSFVVPKAFAEAEIPKPHSPSISLRKVPGGTFAVLRYTGLWNGRVFETKKALLLAAVQKFALKPVGQVSSAVYNPPLTPPFLRRNEVLVRVEKI